MTFPGVIKSLDGGVSWVNSDSGMPTGSPQQFVVLTGPTGTMASLTLPNIMLATIGGAGVYRSQDSGQNWVKSDDGISAHFGLDVAVDPSSPATVYLAASNGGGFFKSTDTGLTWTSLRVGAAHAVAVDPFDPNHLLGAAFGEGLLESADGGASWQPVINLPPPPSGTALIRTIFFHPTVRGMIFICTQAGGAGVLRSTDSGASYSFANTGLSQLAVNNTKTMVSDPANPNVLFLATEDGIFKSTNNGDTWISSSSGLPNGQFDRLIGSITVDGKAIPPVIYAGSFSTKLYKSSDGGTSWAQATVGISGLLGLLVVAADPSTPDSIFISAFGGLVNAGWSPDGGATWKPLSNGLGQVIFSERMAIAQSTPQILLVPSSNSSILRLVIGP